jgi:hypothetical protein
MKRISRSSFLGLFAVGAIALGVTEASAQVLTPSRVGGVLATRGDGTIVMAARSPDGALRFAQRIGFGGVGWAQWDAWYDLGGVLVSTPVTLINSNSKLLIVGRGTDNRLYTRQETAPGSKTFDAWYQIPSASTFVGKPALIRRGDGLLAIYATDASGSVWETTQLTSGGTWGAWQALGTPPGATLRDSPVLAVMNNGAFALFSTGTNHKLYTRVQSGPLGAWGSWTDLGGAVLAGDRVTAAANSNGRVSVIMNNPAATVSFRTQTAVNANSWSPWANLLGGAHGNSLPAVAHHHDGRLAVFFHTSSGAGPARMDWQSQTAPSSTTWGNWFDFQPGATSAPAAIRDIHGKMHVVVLGSGGNAYERVQTAANSATWTDWSSGYFGGPLAPF